MITSDSRSTSDKMTKSDCRRAAWRVCFWLLAVGLAEGFLLSGSADAQNLTELERTHGVGDSPDSELPIPNDLSLDLTPRAVRVAMRKVADWQLERARPYFSQDWTFAALYAGLMAASKTLPEPKYEAALMEWSARAQWQPGERLMHADFVAVAQTYLELYLKHKDPRMIRPIEERVAYQMAQPDDARKPLWWWCDALFMAPPVLARLYRATKNVEYLKYMDREWWTTSDLLYDPREHLYYRDANYLDKREANGRKVFWSRGNGWVMGGLARVLDYMPNNYPSRTRYVAQFREMAASAIKLQQEDGLWRPGLLDPQAYGLPEVSGSAFFAYALAWGIRRGILDGAVYEPAVTRAWRGLLSHVYSDGRLGCIQPVGEAPGKSKRTSSYVYGVGAFLLAGSEISQLPLRISRVSK